jgi:competence protein ComFC
MSLAGLSQRNRSILLFARFFWTAIDWLYPPECCNCKRRGFVICPDCFSDIEVLRGNACQGCGYPINRGKDQCEDCKSSQPAFTQMRSWAKYAGPAQQAIHSLKYQRNLALGAILAKPLIEIVQRSGWTIDLIVPVPLSRSHKRMRGYNQAAAISRNVARYLNIQHSNNAVKRIKETESQISLDVNKRFTNLMDAFYAIPATLNKKNILVIDDVITTGATMQNCALALQKAGAGSIYCVSVARALLRHPKIIRE